MLDWRFLISNFDMLAFCFLPDLRLCYTDHMNSFLFSLSFILSSCFSFFCSFFIPITFFCADEASEGIAILGQLALAMGEELDLQAGTRNSFFNLLCVWILWILEDYTFWHIIFLSFFSYLLLIFFQTCLMMLVKILTKRRM